VRFSRPKRVPSALASLAILAVAFTFFAAQIDFARRNRIGIAAEHYWWPSSRKYGCRDSALRSCSALLPSCFTDATAAHSMPPFHVAPSADLA
jgi:hypothetical protein